MAALIAAVLAGCGSGGGMPMETAEPEPPSLVGTWRTHFAWTHEGVSYKEDVLLTFTKAGRAVIATVAYADGEERWHNYDSHAWSDAGESVVKTGVYDHDNDWETPEVSLPPLDKSYYFVGGDTLLMHLWQANDATDSFKSYTRTAGVTDLPAGEWKSRYGSWEVTIGPDGAFGATETREDGRYYSISGKGTLNLDGHYIELTDLVVESDDRAPRQWGLDGTGTVAVAPAPTGIVLSMPWNEAEWSTNHYRENGHYWLLLEPKQ